MAHRREATERGGWRGGGMELHNSTIFQGVWDQICIQFHLCHLRAMTWDKSIPLKNGANTVPLLDRGVVRCGGLDED